MARRDHNRARRLTLTLGAAGAAGAGLLLSAAPSEHGLRSISGFAYFLTFLPAALATLAALTPFSRPLVMLIAIPNLAINLLLFVFGGIFFMPSACLLVWAGALPSRAPAMAAR